MSRLFPLPFIFICCLAAVSPSIQAQSIINTKWKAFYPPIKDTVTLYFMNDSSSMLTPTGVPVLQSTFKLKDNIIIFHDYGGMSGCPDLEGSYHLNFTANTLTFVMDKDPCDGRGETLITKQWVKVTSPTAP